MLAPGIHSLQPDDAVDVYIDPRHVMIFDETGRAVPPGERLAA
jgi:glycerol transport system ATP-binding protein